MTMPAIETRYKVCSNTEIRSLVPKAIFRVETLPANELLSRLRIVRAATELISGDTASNHTTPVDEIILMIIDHDVASTG